ncbi:hypothetical protein [Planomicrobium okeanokoites]|uniref:hypothetical protein n=1 Tax=Planomicrobium okeanokoites TaxID=244 RepID=UPI000A061BD0|nr:hypothetical protein [Planomicrobium okeanokoites]
MSEIKEGKSKIEQIKELASAKHTDIRFITDGTIEGSKNNTEYAIATDTGLFFYLLKKDSLQPLDHVLWKDVKEIKVDHLAMRTNLTLNGQNYRLVNEGKKITNLAIEKSEAKVEKVDRRWHQKILGFRSGTTWKKIIAVIAYLFLFGFIGSFFAEEETPVISEEENPAEVADEEIEASDEKKEVFDRDGSREDENDLGEVAEEEPIEGKVFWEDEIIEIAATDQSETEKHDAVMALVSDYEFTKEEITTFEEQIISDFKDGTYLADIENHEYMLKNIFKARAIDIFYEDELMEPIDSFAFDFLQNTKYTYRKVDAVDSEAVRTNAEQMKASLSEIE